MTTLVKADVGQPAHEPPGQESPFGTKVPDQQARGARWVEPRLVGEVAFAEWTGGILRQPSWRGFGSTRSPARYAGKTDGPDQLAGSA